jgi:hypothetical protein
MNADSGKTMSNNTETETETKRGQLPGLLRAPLIFLFAIVLGVALNRAWSLPLRPSALELLGPLVTLCAVLLFLLSLHEFRAAGTSVRGSKRTTTIVEPVHIGSVVILSICLSSCSCSDCQFG